MKNPNSVELGFLFLLCFIYLLVKRKKEGEELAKGYYHRSFVILQPRDTRFNIKAEKPAAGYCKIEVRNDKCKMYFHVQDLKPQGADQEGYDVFLVSAQEGIPPQKIASIYVDQRGRGECTVEINVNNIGGSGYSLDQFHGLAVVHNGHDDIRYPLVGYANKRVELDWGGRIKRDIGQFYNKTVKPTFDGRKERSDVQPVEREKREVVQSEMPFSMENKKQRTIQDIIAALGPLLQSKKLEDEIGDRKMQREQEQTKKEPEDVDMKGLDGDAEELKDDATLVYEAKRDEEAVEEQTDDRDSASEALQEVLEAKGDEVAQVGADGETAILLENISQGAEVDEEYKTEKAAAEEILFEEEQAQRQIDEVEQKPLERESVIQWHKSDLVDKQTYWEKTKEYYTRLFETHRRVYPFMVEMGEVQWIEVPYVDDYGQYAYIGAQHMDSVYYYDHYIVGLVKENGKVRYVAYGIPGPYGTMPSMFMQGFSRWVPSRYGYGIGYWLLYVDAYTGEIAYPY